MGISLQAVGDAAVKITFSGNVSLALNKAIQLFCQKVEATRIDGVIEWVPTFNAVTIYYEPRKISYHKLCEKIKSLHQKTLNQKEKTSRLIHIPVVYGGENGPDLQRVADYNQLSTAEVIELHQNGEYLVYMLGFLPGFPYLGGLDTKIATPRLETPRRKTSAGSVGIAHQQTGVYPIESPGGWNIIGKTPLQFFDKRNDQHPFLVQAGDRIHFYQISESKYVRIEKQIKTNTYQVKIEKGDDQW